MDITTATQILALIMVVTNPLTEPESRAHALPLMRELLTEQAEAAEPGELRTILEIAAKTVRENKYLAVGGRIRELSSGDQLILLRAANEIYKSFGPND